MKYFCVAFKQKNGMQVEIFLIIALGIFLGFFIQTVIGFAGALIALPILLFVITLSDAIAYISLFYFLSSIYLVKKEWINIDKKLIIKVAITAIIGTAVGIWVLNFGKPLILKKSLGVFLLIYVVYSFYDVKKFKSSKIFEYSFGFLGGFFSGLFSTGGPLFVILVKNATLDMKTFRATMFGVLGLVSIIRVPMISVGGILNWSHVYYALFVLPFFLLALFLGKKMYSKVNESVMRKSVLTVLFFSGALLLIRS